MNSKIIDIAIIGCGAVTERCHLPALREFNNINISLLVDNNLKIAQELAEKNQIDQYTDEYKEAIDKADAAIVAVPNNLHAFISSELMKAGVHVLVEKPMASSVLECNQMIKIASENRVVLSVGHIRRFLHSARFSYWLIKEGMLGKIKNFSFSEGNIYNWPAKTDSFIKTEIAKGGVLLDTGTHTLDLLLWWLGDITDFKYYDDYFGGVEANCEISLKMKSGARGNVELSRTRNLRNTAVIYGEKAILEVHLRRNWVKFISPNKDFGLLGSGLKKNSDNENEDEQSFTSLFILQIQDWIESINGEHPPEVTGQEALRTISLIEACYEKRRPLKLPWIKHMQKRTSV